MAETETLPYPAFSSVFSGIVLILKMKKQKLKYNIRTYNCLDPVGDNSGKPREGPGAWFPSPEVRIHCSAVGPGQRVA